MSVLTFFFTFVRSQFFIKLPYPTCDFEGQTVVITGSNTGLGLEAAKHIVRLGASKVILAVRTVSKGEKAVESIIESTRATKDILEVWPLDLADFESINAFGARLQTLDRLDAFIQNAGLLELRFKLLEKSGLESNIAVNAVGAVLVGLLALPKLRETARQTGTRTRLSFVGSDAHLIAKCPEAEQAGSLLDAFGDRNHANVQYRYGASKLLLRLTVQELAARSPLGPDSNVIINDETPGMARSELFKENNPIVTALLKFFSRSTEVGSRALVHGVNPTLDAEAHGRFLMDCKIFADWDIVTSEKGQELRKRWVSELLPRLESVSPGVTSVLQQ